MSKVNEMVQSHGADLGVHKPGYEGQVVCEGVTPGYEVVCEGPEAQAVCEDLEEQTSCDCLHCKHQDWVRTGKCQVSSATVRAATPEPKRGR